MCVCARARVLSEGDRCPGTFYLTYPINAAQMGGPAGSEDYEDTIAWEG